MNLSLSISIFLLPYSYPYTSSSSEHSDVLTVYRSWSLNWEGREGRGARGEVWSKYLRDRGARKGEERGLNHERKRKSDTLSHTHSPIIHHPYIPLSPIIIIQIFHIFFMLMSNENFGMLRHE